MKKSHQNIQRQLNSLIPIMESCVRLAPEIEPIKHKLNLLSDKLETLKNEAYFLDNDSAQSNLSPSPNELQKIEFELDSLVYDLELIFASLSVFNGNVKNVAILQEKLEAIQEEIIDGITPERIYKLLEKRERLQHQNPTSSSESFKKHFEEKINSNLWQKIINFSYKIRSRNTVFSLAILASLSLGWIAGYSSSNIRPDETQTVEKANNLFDSSLKI